MSTELDSILDRIAKLDPSLARHLQSHLERNRPREFGLVFKRHLPEQVTLHGRPVSIGDKATILPARDAKKPIADGTFIVTAKDAATGTARLVHLGTHEAVEVPLEDVAFVADFEDPIHPGLRSVGRIDNAPADAPVHTVINGENFHALQALRYTHAGKVDLIYIDPPYNTGTKDWIYNDRYIDPTDGDRHSKWLAFIERRLLIARDLLKDTGVIFVAIGDDEHHRLRMLMDQVFGAGNFISNIVWQGSGKNDARYTAGGVDFMLIYAKSEPTLRNNDIRWSEPKEGVPILRAAATEAWEGALGSADTATATFRQLMRAHKADLEPAVYRYDQIDEQGRIFQAADLTSPNARPNLTYPILHPVSGEVIEPPANGWRYSEETMSSLISEGRILFGPDERTRPRYKRFLDDIENRVPYEVFNQSRMPASSRLKGVLGENRFPNPKDHEVLMRWIRMAAPRDAVVLDFFAGSGSAGEAVIRLNTEDSGTRQAILVTNNEVSAKDATQLAKKGLRVGDPEREAQGVFEYVTKPRLETIVTGTRPDGTQYSDGLPATIEFFDLTYENPALVELDMAYQRIAPLLWLQAGGRGARIDTSDQPWGIADTYAILFDTDHAHDFLTELTSQDRPHLGTVFVVCNDQTQFQAIAAQLPTDIVSHRLYSSYLNQFVINTSRHG